MTISKEINGANAVLTLGGRLDTTTAPQLEAELAALGPEISNLTLDFEPLVYISSAGLRVLLKTQRKYSEQDGSLTLKNVNDEIMDIFDMTGFISFLTIE